MGRKLRTGSHVSRDSQLTLSQTSLLGRLRAALVGDITEPCSIRLLTHAPRLLEGLAIRGDGLSEPPTRVLRIVGLKMSRISSSKQGRRREIPHVKNCQCRNVIQSCI